MKKLIFLLLIIISTHLSANNFQDDFFNHFATLCGKTYQGKAVFPNTPNDSFTGKKLTIFISDCSKNIIKVPLHVGNDQSRTWIISKTDKGLLLKHDHRHADGTPDKVTMYGGYSNNQGTSLSQSFAADEETYKIVPKGKTNVWTLSFDKEKKRLTYYLERHSKPRFKAVFDLTEVIR